MLTRSCDVSVKQRKQRNFGSASCTAKYLSLLQADSGRRVIINLFLAILFLLRRKIGPEWIVGIRGGGCMMKPMHDEAYLG